MAMAIHLVKVFVSQDALVALEDQFVDDRKGLNKFVYEQIRGLARTAKLCKVNGQFMANIEKEGQVKQETYSLKDVDLDEYTVKEDPEWLPDKYDKDVTTYYSIKVGDKTWQALQDFGAIYNCRIDLFNESLPDDAQRKNKVIKKAKCLEQINHEQLVAPVMEKITKNIDAELDKEFDEVNKEAKKKDKKKKKPEPEPAPSK